MNASVGPDLPPRACAAGPAAGTQADPCGAGAAALLPDPSSRLCAAYRAVAPRMAGLGLANPALAVEAVGFMPWEGCWLGMMVTPWFMNLALLPRERAAWRPLAPGGKRRLHFPAGEYEFIGAHDGAIGEQQICPVFSPMQDFADHPSARLVAELALAALFDPANAESPPPPPAERASAGPLAQIEAGLARPLSKRDLLHARFRGGHRADRG